MLCAANNLVTAFPELEMDSQLFIFSRNLINENLKLVYLILEQFSGCL